MSMIDVSHHADALSKVSSADVIGGRLAGQVVIVSTSASSAGS